MKAEDHFVHVPVGPRFIMSVCSRCNEKVALGNSAEALVEAEKAHKCNKGTANA
jgi:hypothetical protein